MTAPPSSRPPVALPIDPVLPDLRSALARAGRVVLQAPPGAGKTTRVPLALLEDAHPGKILMLEPRRLAARAAADRMADSLNEPLGATVGYAIRGERKAGPDTRIEVITEGILTRRIQSDPELAGVGTVIFDEFHERSLNSDLGLALCLDIAGALRDDLRIVVMSATLDAAPVAELIGAPVVTSEGRGFPVETRWLPQPLAPSARFDAAMADLITRAAEDTEGGLLAFLPGAAEIRSVVRRLAGRVPDTCLIQPLYGAMPYRDQQAALRPAPKGQRKLVLATAIAETSLTLPDIRVVVDGGRARRARFDPGSGMSRLVTEAASRAEATQRAGRAGRVAPGVCYRLWSRGAEGARPEFAPPEIARTDLASLALDLANWGGSAEQMSFLTPPPVGALAAARALLAQLGALDAGGRITQQGRAMARLPLHPRLAHMVLTCGPDAAPLAALLSDRDPLRGAPADLTLRIAALRDVARFARERPYEVQTSVLATQRKEARRLARLVPVRAGPPPGLAAMAMQAYPDRIGLRRKGAAPRFLLSGGKGAVVAAEDPLGEAPCLVAVDLDGDAREARVRLGVAASLSELREVCADRIVWVDSCTWDARTRRVVARREERLGALVLDHRTWSAAPPEVMAEAMCAGVRDLGLRLSAAEARFCARVEMARAGGAQVPAMTEAALLETLEDWLAPYLGTVRDADGWARMDKRAALGSRLDWAAQQAVDRLAPAQFITPMGRRVPIDYGAEVPEIAVRLQEMFGVTRHPMVAGQPLRITLLSPAQRPVQVTLDLPGFWRGSYADVRKDMRARYPKHPWPEDPARAEPTLRARPRS